MQSTLSLLQTKRNLQKLSQFSLESDSDSEETGSDFLDVVISMFSRNIWTGKQILHQKLVVPKNQTLLTSAKNVYVNLKYL